MTTIRVLEAWALEVDDVIFVVGMVASAPARSCVVEEVIKSTRKFIQDLVVVPSRTSSWNAKHVKRKSLFIVVNKYDGLEIARARGRTDGRSREKIIEIVI